MMQSIHQGIIGCDRAKLRALKFNRFDIGNLFRGFAAIQGSAGSALDPRVTSKGCAYLPKHCADAFSNSDSGIYCRNGPFVQCCLPASTRMGGSKQPLVARSGRDTAS